MLVSGFDAIAAAGEVSSVAASGTARPLIEKGTAIMAAMAERSAEARILPRRGLLCDSSHHQALQPSQYAQKWAISSKLVDMWERGAREEARNRGLRVVGGGSQRAGAGGGGVGWLLLTAQSKCHAGRLEAVAQG